MQKEIHLISVGKYNDSSFETLEQEFIKRINFPALKVHTVKGHSGNTEKEDREVLDKGKDITQNKTPFLVLLTENGKSYDSKGFSQWLFKMLEMKQEKILFVIAGAMGPGELLKKTAQETFSLSKLTFPHQLARLIFIEQIYRAQTIHLGHPYHH